MEESAVNGLRTVESIYPRMEEWMSRGWGGLTFRSTQILTGHGCFGQYLHRIGRDDTPRCRHCTSLVDFAQHTLEECEAWETESGTV